MKKQSKCSLSFVVEILLVVTMVGVLALLATLPWSVPAVTKHEPGEEDGLYLAYMVVLTVSGLLGEIALWHARGIMRNVNRGTPFCANTVRRLNVIGVVALVMAAFYLATVFWINKFYMLLVFAICAMVGLILFVFAALFRQASKYKEENDMTI